MTETGSSCSARRAYTHAPLSICTCCHRNTGGSQASADHAEQRFRAASEAYEVLGNGIMFSDLMLVDASRFMRYYIQIHVDTANKRDLYNRGQAGGYPRSSAGNWNSATSQQYYSPPRARSGWANYRYQQQKQSGATSQVSSDCKLFHRVLLIWSCMQNRCFQESVCHVAGHDKGRWLLSPLACWCPSGWSAVHEHSRRVHVEQYEQRGEIHLWMYVHLWECMGICSPALQCADCYQCRMNMTYKCILLPAETLQGHSSP